MRQQGTTLEKISPPKKIVVAKPKHIQAPERGVQPPKSLTWVPGHYMPSESIERGLGWSKGAPSYAPEWSGSGATEETYGQGGMRSNTEKKAARVKVLKNGEIDGSSKEKHAWDKSIWNLVPKILDLSVVEWPKQKPVTMQKLRDALDTEFEYIGNPLSTIAFWTLITWWLKHSWLKARWLKGVVGCPIRVNVDQWE